MIFNTNFEDWLAEYIAWRGPIVKALAIPLIDTGPLVFQWQHIGDWQHRAGKFSAEAEFFYRKALWAFIEKRTDLPRSAVKDIAKTACNKELWARMDSDNIRDDLRNRYFQLRIELKKSYDEA